MSPTARSLERLRNMGYVPAIVERQTGPVKQDAFGFVDILAIHETTGDVIAVQATSGSNVASRVTKITDHPNLPVLRAANWQIEVWGWRKSAKDGGWKCRVVDLS